MSHPAGHADANHTEQTGALQQVHDDDTENPPCKGINHTEDSAEKQAGNDNSYAVDGECISESHAVKGDDDYQIGYTKLYAGHGNRYRYKHFHIGKDKGKGGKHGTDCQSAGAVSPLISNRR